MKQCTMAGCGKPVKAKDLCIAHYTRLRRYGDPHINRRKPDTVPTEKACSGCNSVKPLDEYPPDRRVNDGRASRCRDCNRKWVRQYRTEHPEQARAAQAKHGEIRRGDYRWAQRLSRYGLTVETFESLLAGQAGGCAICGTTVANGPGKRFQVDHDHACCPGVGSCGRCIRGLLCSSCNTMIGLAKEDPDRLLAAAAYLRHASGRNE